MPYLKFPVALTAGLVVSLLTGWSVGEGKDAKSSAFISILHSDAPALEHADELKLYGQFVGDWNTDIVSYEPDGTRHRGQGEVHFGWVLHGRAIQDVWMIPGRKGHYQRVSTPCDFFGKDPDFGRCRKNSRENWYLDFLPRHPTPGLRQKGGVRLRDLQVTSNHSANYFRH